MGPSRQILLCTMAAAFVAGAAPFSAGPPLRVERSPMKLRAAGATYDGLSSDPVSPADLTALRAATAGQQAHSGPTMFFPAHLAAGSYDGLGIYTAGDAAWKSYPMFALAIAARWYTPRPGESGFLESIRGVATGAGRVWMGTGGVGIVARDLRGNTWSRYDVKAGILNGIHTEVFCADDEYLLAFAFGPGGDWHERLPGVVAADLGPALEVYSVRRDAWLRVRAVPHENVIAFGWTTSQPGIPIPFSCDARRYAGGAEMPITMCTHPSEVTPAADGSGYVLVRTFAEPGAPLRYTIRKEELESAFATLR